MNKEWLSKFINALPEENRAYLKEHAQKKEGIFMPTSAHEEMG